MSMFNKTQNVILTENRCEGCCIPNFRAYHRNSPETWAEGESAAEAIAQLLQLLTRDLDKVAGQDHREVLEGLIADVQEYQNSNEWANEDSSPVLAGR